MPTDQQILSEEQPLDKPATVRCQNCEKLILKQNACAIGRTFIAFYYCADCFEIVANEE